MGPGFFLEEEKLSARKLIFAALAVCSAVRTLAGPILTTIQDVIYNADGTPYNGFAVIKWTPFVAGDTSQIAMPVSESPISVHHRFCGDVRMRLSFSPHTAGQQERATARN